MSGSAGNTWMPHLLGAVACASLMLVASGELRPVFFFGLAIFVGGWFITRLSRR